MAKKKTVYAGFWLRLCSYVIDSIILAGFGFLIGLLLGALMPEFTGYVLSNKIQIFWNVLTILIGWVYYAGMESSSKQATLGKLALGLKVVDSKKRPISFLRASGRFFGKILSGIILGIGFIMIGFTKKKQGLHDILAGCLIVKT